MTGLGEGIISQEKNPKLSEIKVINLPEKNFRYSQINSQIYDNFFFLSKKHIASICTAESTSSGHRHQQ